MTMVTVSLTRKCATQNTTVVMAVMKLDVVIVSDVLKAYCIILHTLHYLIGNCSGSSFHCASGECVLQEQVCNSINDCADGSDEFGCGKIQLQEQW